MVVWSRVLLSTWILSLPGAAGATNALNMIAYDARSAGMGGAVTALESSTLCVATNPAGITGFPMRLDGNFSFLVPMMTMSDRVVSPQYMELNAEKKADVKPFPLFGVGFSRQIWRGLYGGIGVFIQGGMGVDFKGLATFSDPDPTKALTSQPSPHTYDTHSQLMLIKIAPTLAYRYKAVSVGLSVHLGLAQMEWSHSGMQFPEQDGDHVYYPHSVDFSSDYVFGVAPRFGVTLRLLEGKLSFGVSYMMSTALTFEGEMTLDDKLVYDASTDDFGWAGELSAGVAGRLLGGRLVLAAAFRWSNWSDTVDRVTFEATARDTANTPKQYASLKMPFQMGWGDSLSVALGGELAVVEDYFYLRLGYLWATPVVSGDGINTLFPPLAEHHLTAGLGLGSVARGLGLSIAVEVALPNSVESSEDNQMAHEPAMPGAKPSPNGYVVQVAMQQVTIHLMLNYVF